MGEPLLVNWYGQAEQVQGWFNEQELAPIINIISKAPSDSIFVEIGIWKGHSTVAIASEFTGGRYIAIDHFRGSNVPICLEDPELPYIQEIFKQNLEKFGLVDRVEILAEESVEAAKHFEDNSVDFILLDGSHEYLDVKADIAAWWPKLKVGGKMFFHDQGWPDVRQAIEEAELVGEVLFSSVFMARKEKDAKDSLLIADV